MKIYKSETKEELTIRMLEEVYNGPANIKDKIAMMIVTRRENHGNDKIQNKCNEYLTKLYDIKYEQISKGEYVW